MENVKDIPKEKCSTVLNFFFQWKKRPAGIRSVGKEKVSGVLFIITNLDTLTDDICNRWLLWCSTCVAGLN